MEDFTIEHGKKYLKGCVPEIKLKTFGTPGRGQLKNLTEIFNNSFQDDRETEKKVTSIVQVIDQNFLSREGYRALVAVEPDLEREWIKIAISLINIPIIPTLDELDFAESSYIFDWKSNPLAFSYHNNQSFEHTLSHKLKGHAFIHLKVHGICQLIAYFETHEHLLRCMEFKHHWKLTISTPPTKKIPQKSKKDKKPYSQQSKGKNLGKSLSSLTRSCNKSNTQQKTEDTRSLLLKLLNLLVKSVALISFVGPKKAVNWCLR
ncbi:15320_t:CDS:2 [Rhizophagus irregularis]|nr:15320_t:CDS:2 [Rhizophagus irregularis]